eukprot:TRINITY_DN5645_c0_g1_i2.p1 TRINITY_DN5645_c0_g1~~TRINITY_DN5645_c0_g1_i2.p1  ORF type:complete len:319 (+),score=40.00 TRINITY_DN5645_c0_g1_i2:64-1020(+)
MASNTSARNPLPAPCAAKMIKECNENYYQNLSQNEHEQLSEKLQITLGENVSLNLVQNDNEQEPQKQGDLPALQSKALPAPAAFSPRCQGRMHIPLLDMSELDAESECVEQLMTPDSKVAPPSRRRQTRKHVSPLNLNELDAETQCVTQLMTPTLKAARISLGGWYANEDVQAQEDEIVEDHVAETRAEVASVARYSTSGWYAQLSLSVGEEQKAIQKAEWRHVLQASADRTLVDIHESEETATGGMREAHLASSGERIQTTVSVWHSSQQAFSGSEQLSGDAEQDRTQFDYQILRDNLCEDKYFGRAIHACRWLLTW